RRRAETQGGRRVGELHQHVGSGVGVWRPSRVGIWARGRAGRDVRVPEGGVGSGRREKGEGRGGRKAGRGTGPSISHLPSPSYGPDLQTLHRRQAGSPR